MALEPEDLQAVVAAVLAAMDARNAAPADEPEPETPADEPAPDDAPPADDAPALSDEEKAKLQKTQDGITLERYRRDQQALAARLAESEKRARDLERYNRKADRKAELVGLLREGYDFNLAETLEDLVDEPAERYAKSIERIRKNYARSLDGQPLLETDPSARPARAGDDYLTAADMPKLQKYQRDNPGLSYDAALERYKADKRDGKIAR